MKNYKSVILMCIFSTLANCGKSEVTAAQEFPNGRILVKDPTAVIGSGENCVKTPNMIVAPDARSGFANDFMTNAISIVTEDCVNYYAHVLHDRTNRTKVIHFTIDKNGIPSRTGNIIDTVNSGEESNVTKMKGRKLVGVKNGYLFFFADSKYDTCLIYNPQTGTVKPQTQINQQTGLQEPERSWYWDSYQNDTDLYILTNYISVDTSGNSHTNGRCQMVQSDGSLSNRWSMAAVEGGTLFTVINDEIRPNGRRYGTFYSGDSHGRIRVGSQERKRMEGSISGLSNNGNEVFATSSKETGFYNVNLGVYNVVKDENGKSKPMVPQTAQALIRVIDNRKKNGKFLYVTSKGVHSIE